MPPRFRQRILVIGGGLGGLAAAIRLQLAGRDVTVIERNPATGGKMGALEWEGFHWDTGPSLLTMPHVLEDLWNRAGRKLEDDLELVRLPVGCRYRWQDGTVIDEDEAFWARPEMAAVRKAGQGVYDLGAEAFLHRPLEEWQRHLHPGRLANLRHLPKVVDPRPLSSLAARHAPESAHLRQIIGRFATYNGSSPFRTPSAFSIIPFVQARFGSWYVRGGMRRVADGLVALARRLGVGIETGLEAVRLQPNGDSWTIFVRPTDGGPARPMRGDGIVCNQDALAATQRFLDPGFVPRRALSTAGFVIFAAVDRPYPELLHHNIFFSRDYRREFAELFDDLRPPEEPTIYISISSKSEPARAPEGCENWFVLVNAPPVQPKFDWVAQAPRYADRILGMLPSFGLDDPRPHVRWMRTFTPEDFAARDLSWGGALYGYASHGARAAFLRPPVVSGHPGLVFAGGSTHPGGGVPLVLLSGQIAARALSLQLGGPDLDLPDPAPSA